MTDLAVIMSVYSRDRLTFVRESVESILDQTFEEFHFYIAFDGPVSDDVENYIASISDVRIRLYKIEKNQGLAAALNFLLRIVMQNPCYKYIARMDADDISLPERFEKQRKSLINNPEISVLGSWYEEIDEACKHLHYRKLPVSHEDLEIRYFIIAPFPHSSVMFHKRLIESVSFYPTDTILMEDNVLWGKAIKAGLKLANIPEYLLKLRIDKNFYRRRSGIKYGWNYIQSKIRINRSIQCPPYYSLLILIGGIIRMFPPVIFRAVRNLVS